jgi:general secretion pathway protein A
MYLEHFGLRDKPFELGCDLSRYYPAAHQEPQNDLLYALEERQGVATLIGEPGTGKTTLLKNVLRLLGPDLLGILLSDVALSGGSLLRQVLTEIGPTETMEQGLLKALGRAIDESIRSGRAVVLMVDEAQALTDRQLQEVQYLSNLEAGGEKVVQMILAGQPSLEARLEEPQFKALSQRVAVRSQVKPLSLRHTRGYVGLRLQASGVSESGPFVGAAVTRLHELSGGIPRMINLIADRALVIAYADDLAVVDEPVVLQAADELRIRKSTGDPRPAPIPAPLEQRLQAIEGKLDSLLAALERAGLLSPAPGNASASAEGEPDRSPGLVADFPTRQRPT